MMKLRFLLIAVFIKLFTQSAAAQIPETTNKEQFSFHAQTTIVNQAKSGFHALYTGENSLSTAEESQTSITTTLFMAARLWNNGSVYLNPEIAGGSGLSSAMGVADATNGETFRVGDPAPKLYIARCYFRQIFPLSNIKIMQETDQNQLAGEIPSKYISVSAGKLGIADFFDDNKYSHDPRTQFLSWSLMDNGAWDYPADTRGYTPAIVVEYISPIHELRYSVALLSTYANGPIINYNISQSSSHLLEYVHRHTINKLNGAVRLLGFVNTTHMGNYKEAIKANPTSPDIVSTEKNGRTKYGITINAEQELNSFMGCFFRAGWNDGQNETWAFTEIDRTISGGISANGKQWKRPYDNVGIAFVQSMLSDDHIQYLKAGGKGFILGDGTLNYAPERLFESYYSLSLSKNIFLTGTYQLLFHPGYNIDRGGPVNIFSMRLHVEI